MQLKESIDMGVKEVEEGWQASEADPIKQTQRSKTRK